MVRIATCDDRSCRSLNRGQADIEAYAGADTGGGGGGGGGFGGCNPPFCPKPFFLHAVLGGSLVPRPKRT